MSTLELEKLNKEYDLTMSQIQKMLKEGYKIEFI